MWDASPRCLQTGHGSKKKDQHSDSHERERGACEKLRYSIETLAAPGLHECDQSQNESNRVTDHCNGDSGLRGPSRHGPRQRTAQEAKPKKEKRREPEFAEVIHSFTCLNDGACFSKRNWSNCALAAILLPTSEWQGDETILSLLPGRKLRSG